MKLNTDKIINNYLDSGAFVLTKELYAEYFGKKLIHVSDKNLQKVTRDQLFNLIKKKYWDACGCDSLPNVLDELVFRTAATTSVAFAIKALQKDIAVEQTGILDTHTLSAISKAPLGDLSKCYLAQLKNTCLQRSQEVLPA